MHRFIVMSASVVLILVGAAEPACAAGLSEEQALPDSLRTRDEREEWRVGIALFEGRDLSEAAASITETVPLLIRDDVADIAQHKASAAETYAYQRYLRNKAVIAAGRELDTAIAERDRMAAGPNLAERREAVARARENLTKVEAVSPASIPVATERPVRLVADGDGLLTLEGSPQHTAVQEDLDVLIHGSARDLNGFVEIEVAVYSRFRKERAFSDTVITRPAAAYRATRDLRDRIIAEVLGRPWASLTVSTPNENASIYVDGRFVGIGEARLSRTHPGIRTLQLRLPGGQSHVESVELEAFEVREINVALETQGSGELSLRSTPEGASVYVGSQWRGRTPLTIQRPFEPVPYRLVLDGYNDAFGFVGPETAGPIDQDLVPDVVDQAALVEERRDSFYGAFGAFVLSVPVPIILNGLYQGVLSLFPPDGSNNPRLTSEENTRLARLGTAYFYASRGGMFVSAGLFANLAIQLGRYVDASRYKHQIPEE